MDAAAFFMLVKYAIAIMALLDAGPAIDNDAELGHKYGLGHLEISTKAPQILFRQDDAAFSIAALAAHFAIKNLSGHAIIPWQQAQALPGLKGK